MSVEVQPRVLVIAGGDVLDESVALGKIWLDQGVATQALASSAAGNTAGGAGLVAAAVGCAEGASGAMESLVFLLETASDVLYTCAFGYSDTDEAVAANLEMA